MSESSSTSDGGTTESTGEPTFPEWAIGVFSTETEKVGTTIDNPLWYGWGNIEISATGMFVLDWYNCSEHYERQTFRWTMADDGHSLNVRTVPPVDVFTFGNGHQVSELIVEPGSSCDTITIRYRLVDPIMWIASEQQRGEICAEPIEPEGCTFAFEWCDGEPPAPCE